MKKTVFSWVILLASSSLFVYDLVNNTTLTPKFHLFDLQIVESILIALLLITSWENYYKTVKNLVVHLFSTIAIFVLLTTVKYEFDSTFLSVLHAMCYTYLFVILVITNKKR